MLRITPVAATPARVTLKLEGRLVADWASLLAEACQAARQAHRQVRLDLAEVTFIDGRGVAVLQRLAADGVELLNPSAFAEALLARAGVPYCRSEEA
ncbi:MAG: hypothetical protein KatS3mg131_1751 [Candidatus Tectimicrobiota bacterium]|nr:MAG: hypothetical protein KatS3mg131_1751 [Candidatus Tectomicrobia bacterium]